MNYGYCKKLRSQPSIHPITNAYLSEEEMIELDIECSEIERERLKKNKVMQRFTLYSDSDIFNYSGNEITGEAYILYLMKKYDTCKVKSKTKIVYNIETKKLKINHNKECDIYIDMMTLYDTDFNINHANALIINNITKTIERFEPHGNTKYYDQNKLDIKLSNYAKRFGLTYVNMSDSCLPLQSKEDVFYDINRSCMIWSLWYIEYRLQNPALSKSDIIRNFNILYNQDNLLLHKMIVYFVGNMVKSKIEFYRWIVKNYPGDRYNYLRVLIDMYEKYSVKNRFLLSYLISRIEFVLYNDIIKIPNITENYILQSQIVS